MACLSITKPFISASLSANHDSTASPPQQSNLSDAKPSIPVLKTNTKLKSSTPPSKKSSQQSKLQQQLNLMKMEQAIGAGSYRDSDPTGSEQKESIFNGVVPNEYGVLEGPLERKLRETGEWLSDKTEKQFRSSSSSKRILMFFLKWVLPLYILMFLVTTGTVKLPFSTPFLDDFLL
ncbi:probable NAD(P)H dehydrogenase subunit CRR3, chloroplastic [Mercurialis annua]|uniref:probable NAD(P)H dehydrogenase subunit CRR3, chloroplastic n=1 Tax=Mercurialis annua TaxID=3986 RepID=UPI002160243E|nr:probable NAD(P)H dehydrogenase subunit CRR3, chloroplastic [Mercurialis annua]